MNGKYLDVMDLFLVYFIYQFSSNLPKLKRIFNLKSLNNG
jgi:hypothetical protein